MTARPPRHAVLATLLALLAVLTMSALAGWHAATFHDDAPIAATATVDRDDAGDRRGDPDRAIHVAAHEIGHGLAVPVAVAPPPPLSPTTQPWVTSDGVAHRAIAAIELLRPPRG